MRATLPVKLTTVGASQRRWRGIIFLQPSSTLKKALSKGWPCTVIFCIGSLDSFFIFDETCYSSLRLT